MASIQQSIGGLTGSIFAATAMGSHLIQGSPEYQAGKKYKAGTKLAEKTGEPLKEELAAHDLAQQKAEELLGEAVLLNPTEKHQRAYSEQVEYNKELREAGEDWDRQLRQKEQRDIEEEEARRQIGRIIMEAGRRDLSRQTTLDYASQIEKYQKEFAARGGNQQ